MDSMPGASVAIVTDSTSYLPPGWARERGIGVVPVQVIVAGRPYDETDDDQAGKVTEALSSWQPVTTSRPSPVRFLEAFARCREAGAEAVAVVTMSSAMSATHESAVQAALECDLPVEVVDSRTIAMGLGFAALSGAEAAAEGQGLPEVCAAIRARAAASSAFFYVDTLEYLRRGGRVGTAKAAVAQALQVKPILTVADGSVTALDQVRTAGKALARLEHLALESARQAVDQGLVVEIAVQSLAAAERSAELATRLADALPEARVVECAVGGVVGAHVGPGMVAVVVAPRPGAAR